MENKNTFMYWLFHRGRHGSRIGLFFTYFILALACVIAIYPVLRVFSVSLRPGDRLLSTSLDIIPKDASLVNYKIALFDKDFLRWLYNSLIITCTTAVIGLMLASASAYAFARFNFKGKNTWLIFLFTSQMIPAAMLMVPLYIMVVKFGLFTGVPLINTYRGLVFAYAVGTVPFSIWMLKGYYDTIPVELEEAAMIDGLTRIQTFWKIILPLSTPALAICFLFNFMSSWSEFLMARIMLQASPMFTWPQGLQSMQNQFRTEWGAYSASALMVAVPVMILFLASSKWLVSGITLGSVKG